MQKIVVTLIFLLTSNLTFSQSITDVNSSRHGDSIVVEYIYEGSLISKLYLWVSFDGGKWWDGPQSSVKGNVGNYIHYGNNKMVWNVTEDTEVFFGDSILFRVASGPQNHNVFVDQRDGKKYKTTKVDNSVWMAENLNYDTDLGSCYYQNTDSYSSTYGRLYSWSVAQQVCPVSWHLPTESEWDNLILKYGGKKIAGDYLKSEYEWGEPYSSKFNLSKFSALPGGCRDHKKQYKYLGSKGLWWTPFDYCNPGIDYTIETARYYMIESKKKKIYSEPGRKTESLSVRCVSDPIFFGESSQPSFYSIIDPDCNIKNVPFEAFAINYIEEKILSWQIQKSGEKRSDYLFRISEERWKSRHRELAREAKKEYKNEICKTIEWGKLEIGNYNSSSENIELSSELLGHFNLHIPINEIITFRQNLKSLVFGLENYTKEEDSILISKISISVPTNGKTYSHEFNSRGGYDPMEDLNKYYSFDMSEQEQISISEPGIISDMNNNANSKSILNVKDPALMKPEINKSDEMINSNNTPLNQEFGKYFALLIAVDNYEDVNIQDLDEPFNDANKLYGILTKDYLFEKKNVQILKDPRRADIISSLDDLNGKITADDNLLIFFAGHGKWDESMNTGYWLPTNADLKSTADWFRNSTLIGYIDAFESKHTLVIADACFAGQLFKHRGTKDEMQVSNKFTAAKLHKLPSRKAMTSGAKENVPDESVFMFYLTKRLQQNSSKYLSSEELFSSLRNAVLHNSPTTPRYGEIMNAGDEGGDFIFIRR